MADKYVTKISGSPIAAVIAARDADGKQIDTTYVKHDSDGNVTISGNLTVNGSTTTVSTENLAIKDPMLRLANGNTAALSTLIGFRATKIDGSNDALLAVSSTGDVYAGLFANSTLDSGITASTSGLYKLAKNSDVTTLQGYFANGIANNADKLDGYHATSTGNYWNVIPYVRSADGVMEIGQYIDFHTDSAGSRDYDGRIQGQKNGGCLLIPTKSGTIALDSVATTTANGLMSSGDKTKLDGIARGTTVFEVTRGSSHTTAKTGYWAAMLNTASTGAPVLPTPSGWWHVISMDWDGTDLTNWISQIAFPTQDQTSNTAVDSPYYRHNAASTSIDNATWHKFITDQNIGSQSVSYATSAGSATTSKYPAGFSGYDAGFTWGNSTGTSIASWNTSTGGSVGWKNDNPSSGKVSMLIDGRVYVDEGTYPVMGMNLTNGYWGIGDPDGASTDWIRTTSPGIIPYSSGGSGSLGTVAWPFAAAYINTIYEEGTSLSKKYIKSGISTTYSQLKSLRDAGTLSPGATYRITDYEFTTTQTGSSSAGHGFDILVIADDSKTLNENARAIARSGDTYYSDSGDFPSDLSAWELKYCLDNDLNRFSWADTTNGKGVIYYMKDDRGNIAPYDHKNCLFIRYKVTNSISALSSLSEQYLGTTAGVSTGLTKGTDTKTYLTFDKYCYDNRIEPYRVSVTVDRTAYADTAKLNDITICAYSQDRTNTTTHLYGNTFEANCHDITFAPNYSAPYCDSNSFGNSCSSNSFGNRCYCNSFGNSCSSNSFGNSCNYNSFGNDCNYNSFGNRCSSNSFGNYCYYNSFGNDCYYNYLCSSKISSTYLNYAKYNAFENGVAYVSLYNSSATGSSSAYLQNVHIHEGVLGTSSSRKTISVSRNLAYGTDVYAEGHVTMTV